MVTGRDGKVCGGAPRRLAANRTTAIESSFLISASLKRFSPQPKARPAQCAVRSAPEKDGATGLEDDVCRRHASRPLSLREDFGMSRESSCRKLSRPCVPAK